MAETYVSRPADPAEHVSTYGGFAEIARRINALHPERPVPISRQLVAKWYECREVNGMPDRHPVQVGGKIKTLFHLDSVVRWHTNKSAGRPVNPPIETIPLFNVDHRGHPIDSESASYRSHPEVRETYRSSILDL